MIPGRGKRAMAWCCFFLIVFLALTGSVEILAIIIAPFAILIPALMGLDVGQEIGKIYAKNQ